MTQTVLDIDVIAKAVELACRAPSLYNTQPWRWVVGHTAVDLFAEPLRVVRSTDSSGREAIVSCGAVLDHFQTAMVAAGWNTKVDEFPDPDRPDHLASIHFVPLDHVTEAWRERADAILWRRSDRLPFRAPANWESFEPVLRGRFNGELVTLDVLADDAQAQLAEASRLIESIRRYDDFYHHELQWWTAPFRQSEGIPPSDLVSLSEADRVTVHRDFPIIGHGDRRATTAGDQAKILVLSTPEDTRADALHSGQALSAVLLECTMAGLATCSLTHITEMDVGRDVIRGLIANTAMPQVLIRVGTVPDIEGLPPPAPRRRLSEVLEIHC